MVGRSRVNLNCAHPSHSLKNACFTVSPQIKLSSKALLAEEGQNITIACTTTDQPQPSITWSKSFGNLPNGRTEVFSGKLKIYNVAKKDRGTYICKAKNILSNKVTWTRNGKSSLPVDSNFLHNGTLVLQNIKKSHEGIYTCRATNALTTIEAKVRINAPVTATSCSKIRKYVSSVSRNYVIDPDGVGGLAPLTVFCDMIDKNGVGVTVVSHDSERRTLVNGYSRRGSYSRDIHYTGASLSQLASLTRVSSHCEQFIKYECFHSVLLYNNNAFGWWVSHDSTKLTYWGGASVSGKCACGMTNSCAKPSYGCNCDANDKVWREDSGPLTYKSHLPVRQLRFGNTGGSNEKGYHTLGKLKCYGTV